MRQLLKKFAPRFLLAPLQALRARVYLTSPAMTQRSIGRVDPVWRHRIDEAVASPDNEQIPRVPEAGRVEDYHVTMHNGVKVCANGYYGGGMLNLLIENRGVHEPQEERVFEEVLALLDEAPTMLELGAYWGFYSLSLLQQRPEAKCYLVEPNSFNLASGKLNFRLNEREGRFTRARVGDANKRFPKMIAVDPFCEEHGVERLTILHADIQGAESTMLDGARRMLAEQRVDYVFVSTHSKELHADCLSALRSHGYAIFASVDTDESFSCDGLIVAARPGVALPAPIELSKRAA